MSTIPKNDMRQRMEGRTITTLGDYIEQKSDKPDPKKLKFEEWWAKNVPEGLWFGDIPLDRLTAEVIWEVAQANK